MIGGSELLRAERCSIGGGVQSELQIARWVAESKELQGGLWISGEARGWVATSCRRRRVTGWALESRTSYRVGCRKLQKAKRYRVSVGVQNKLQTTGWAVGSCRKRRGIGARRPFVIETCNFLASPPSANCFYVGTGLASLGQWGGPWR